VAARKFRYEGFFIAVGEAADLGVQRLDRLGIEDLVDRSAGKVLDLLSTDPRTRRATNIQPKTTSTKIMMITLRFDPKRFCNWVNWRRLLDNTSSRGMPSALPTFAALRRPFVYFPVDGHFEQEIVAARLARYGVGRRMSLSGTTPDELADAILGEYAHSGASAPSSLPTDGARNAAMHILRLLEDRRLGAPPRH